MHRTVPLEIRAAVVPVLRPASTMGVRWAKLGLRWTQSSVDQATTAVGLVGYGGLSLTTRTSVNRGSVGQQIDFSGSAQDGAFLQQYSVSCPIPD